MIFQCDVAPVQPRDVGVGVGISRLHLRVDIRLLPVDVPPHHVWIRGEPGQTIRDCQPSSAGSGPLLWGRPAGQGSDRQREGAHPPRPQQAEGQAGREAAGGRRARVVMVTIKIQSESPTFNK